MNVKLLRPSEVRRLLPMAECVDLMEETLRTLSRGDAVQPLRSILRLPNRPGLLGMMPGYLGGSARALGIKVITLMPEAQGMPFPSHQGGVLLFEPEHGALLAVLDGAALTAIRTAAVSGSATRALARADASVLALLGSGVQAGAHLAAMRAVRPIGRVRVWSRSPARSLEFATRESAHHGVPVEPVGTPRDAVEGAEIVCTVTAAREPILEGAWISPGAHLNAVGACIPTSRELDSEAVRRSRVFVDRMESALSEAGDLLIPIREGTIRADKIAGEIGDVFSGTLEGRRNDGEITLFKSLGIAVEDLAAARRVYERALASGEGVEIEWGGSAYEAD
jgi:alanine dehydrogenase